MMIRQDFDKLPPKMFMMQIMDNIAKSYCFLWERRDDMNKIEMTWKELSKYYHKNCFRSSLRKLCAEGLLNFDESDNGILVELVGWDEVMDD